MASRYFSIEFNDLSFDKKQELIEELAKNIRENWQEEVKQLLEENKFNELAKYDGKNWQEIICREYDFDWELWETEEETKNFDWNYAVEQEAEKQAENRLYTAMKYLGLEVEL